MLVLLVISVNRVSFAAEKEQSGYEAVSTCLGLKKVQAMIEEIQTFEQHNEYIPGLTALLERSDEHTMQKCSVSENMAILLMTKKAQKLLTEKTKLISTFMTALDSSSSISLDAVSDFVDKFETHGKEVIELRSEIGNVVNQDEKLIEHARWHERLKAIGNEIDLIFSQFEKGDISGGTRLVQLRREFEETSQQLYELNEKAKNYDL